jgi:hypothetical protein
MFGDCHLVFFTFKGVSQKKRSLMKQLEYEVRKTRSVDELNAALNLKDFAEVDDIW